MKDGDKIVIAYDIMKHTRPYFPRDKIANRLWAGNCLDSCRCDDPKIMFPKVNYTGELKWSKS